MPSPAPLRASLLAWFDAHRRDLPWRRTSDPYAVWVSEVMLQQTRVETVLPYFERWIERFPDMDALAAADEGDVLKAWEGLGYYRRARSLRRAASLVRERYGGELPRTAEALRELPGVGEYTAGAVASIAFGEAVPAVDGNVRRVLARLFDEPSPARRWLRETAEGLVDPVRPGDFNQALMELGATVCGPARPLCDACPLGGACLARAAGTVAERPAAAPRRAVAERAFAVAVAVSPDGRALVIRRRADGMLGGLWEFPSVEAGAGVERGEVARDAATGHGAHVGAEPPRALAAVRQAYSHFTGVYHPFLMESPPGEDEVGEREWATSERLDELALPRAHRRIARAVEG